MVINSDDRSLNYVISNVINVGGHKTNKMMMLMLNSYLYHVFILYYHINFLSRVLTLLTVMYFLAFFT